jgi:hypothetical protein
MGGTFRKALVIGGVLIGAYLVLEHNTGFSKDVKALGTSSSSLVKALQARK